MSGRDAGMTSACILRALGESCYRVTDGPVPLNGGPVGYCQGWATARAPERRPARTGGPLVVHGTQSSRLGYQPTAVVQGAAG